MTHISQQNNIGKHQADRDTHEDDATAIPVIGGSARGPELQFVRSGYSNSKSKRAGIFERMSLVLVHQYTELHLLCALGPGMIRSFAEGVRPVVIDRIAFEAGERSCEGWT